MRPLARILRFTSELTPYYIGIVVASVITAALSLAVPFVVGAATDVVVDAVAGLRTAPDATTAVLWLAVVFFAAELLGTLVSSIGGYWGDVMSAKMRALLSTRYFAKLLSLPQSYFDSELTGTITSRLNRSITELTNFVKSFSNSFFTLLLTTVAVLVISAWYWWPLALLLVIVFPVYMWLTALTSTHWQKVEGEKNAEVDAAGGRFNEVVGQIRVVKSFVAERRELTVFSERFARTVGQTRVQSTHWHGMDAARRAFMNVVFAVIYGIIFVRTVQGQFSVGDMVLLIQLMNMARQPITMMSYIIDTAQHAIAGSVDYFKVMDTDGGHEAAGLGEISAEVDGVRVSSGPSGVLSGRAVALSDTALLGVPVSASLPASPLPGAPVSTSLPFASIPGAPVSTSLPAAPVPTSSIPSTSPPASSILSAPVPTSLPADSLPATAPPASSIPSESVGSAGSDTAGLAPAPGHSSVGAPVPAAPRAPDGGPVTAEGVPAVAFHGVTFGYDAGVNVLDGVTFDVARGERVAFVGESGGGKTTLVNLLLGLYPLRDGAVEVFGQEVASVPLLRLRRAIGVVFQDPALFSGTVRENIAYSSPDATDEQIEAAARSANAHPFITRFPEDYDSMIGERGLKLSGGQRQRIAVARAILKDAPILVLDEATSALDTKSERLVQQGLETLMRGRTSLIIAHRLSTIAAVDRIVTLKDGRVDEIGTPAELAQSEGIYAELLALQHSGTQADKKRMREFDISG